jgi:GrpB-like predicted nucleotidyltransferase (UPF0157 family)
VKTQQERTEKNAEKANDGEMKKSREQRIEEAIREEISIVPYNSEWPSAFETEAEFLLRILPGAVVKRIEHFGSTAVPGLAAKPVIDILVEVSSLVETQKQIVPLLESLGYDYFWRTDCEPPYAWFIKRNSEGRRTHHIHMVEADSKLWDTLYFRDYLRMFSSEARQYEQLKKSLAGKHPRDRVSYTHSKSEFIVARTEKAKRYFKAS